MIAGIVTAMMFFGTMTANAQGFDRNRDRKDSPKKEYSVSNDRDRRDLAMNNMDRDRNARGTYRMENMRQPEPRPAVVHHVEQPAPRHEVRHRHSDGSTIAAVAAGAVLASVLISATR